MCGNELGFFYDETSDDPQPDAWCGSCDEIMMADDDWNEENEKMAKITILCQHCYDEAKERNEN